MSEEPTEAARVADEIFTTPLGWEEDIEDVAAKIIQRLLDEKDRKYKTINDYCDNLEEECERHVAVTAEMTEQTAAEKAFEKELRWIIDTQKTSSWSDKMKMINEEFIALKDAEIERLKQQLKSAEALVKCASPFPDWLKQRDEEIERLKQQLAEATNPDGGGD